jgi:hypothetical protein
MLILQRVAQAAPALKNLLKNCAGAARGLPLSQKNAPPMLFFLIRILVAGQAGYNRGEVPPEPFSFQGPKP